MNIYVGHSNDIDYVNELYIPIRNSVLNTKHFIVLPHEKTSEPFNSKSFFTNCDLVIAEVSAKSTGLGIELGWANLLGIPIVCIYKKGSSYSSSLSVVSNIFLEYESNQELIEKIESSLKI